MADVAKLFILSTILDELEREQRRRAIVEATIKLRTSLSKMKGKNN